MIFTKFRVFTDILHGKIRIKRILRRDDCKEGRRGTVGQDEGDSHTLHLARRGGGEASILGKEDS
jgi:hypothetical protein